MTIERQGQIAVLRNMRRSYSDTAWLLDDDLEVVYCEEGYGAKRNCSLPVVGRDEFVDWCARMRCAPARESEGAFHYREAGRYTVLHMSGVYLPDGAGSGHFFITATARRLPGVVVLERLRKAYKVRTDAELAARLGTSASTVSRARKTSVPANWIIKGWQDTGVSADWLLTGQGKRGEQGSG